MISIFYPLVKKTREKVLEMSTLPTRAAKSRDRRDRRSREASTSQGEAMAKGKKNIYMFFHNCKSVWGNAE